MRRMKLFLAVLFMSVVVCAESISWKVYFYNEANDRNFAVYQPENGAISLPGGKVVRGVECKFVGDALDLDAIAPEGTNRAVLEGMFNCDKARSTWLGIGCKVFSVDLNGSNIYEFLKKGLGNDYEPVTSNDHIFPAKFAKGDNRIVIQTYRTNWLLDFCYGVEQRAKWRLCFKEQADYRPTKAKLAHPALFTRPENGGVMVTFITESPVPAGIDYRKLGDKDWTRAWDLAGNVVLREASRVHRIQLEDFLPETDYEYRIVMLEPPAGLDGARRALWFKRKYKEVYSPVKVFRNGDRRNFSFILFGDTQLSLSNGCKTVAQREAILDAMRASTHYMTADFIVHVGDVTSYSHNIEKEMFTEFFDGFAPKGNEPDRAWVYLRGNHETNGLGSEEWFDFFAPEGKGNFYSFMRGNVFFIVLDCGDFPEDPTRCENGPLIFRKELMRRQEKWLQALKETPDFRNAKFRVILCHTEPMLAQDSISKDILRITRPLLDEGKIQLWLAGHVHYYWRMNKGSSKLLTMFNCKKKPAMPKSPVTFVTIDGPKSSSKKPDLSYLHVKASDDSLSIEAYDENGVQLDAFKVNQNGDVFDEKSSPAIKQIQF